MRKGIKILILTSILLTPAAIYIFLQSFGQNEFDLPLFSEEGNNGDPDPRVFSFEELYDSDGIKVDQDSFASDIVVLEFISSQSDQKKRDFQIKRISDIFRDEKSVRILRIFVGENHAGSVALGSANQLSGNISLLYAGDIEISKMIPYVFSTDESPGSSTEYDKMILLDNQKRIRGSYSVYDFEEIDRLILEVKILLKKEQHA